MPESTQTKVKVPEWFRNRVAMLFSLYPGASLSTPTVLAWWEFLGHFDQRALQLAFAWTPSGSPTFCPTAPMVAEWAASIEKTAVAKTTDLTRPELVEPEPDMSHVDPEIRDLLEKLKNRPAATGGGT
jgi:hypothetical protein